MIESCYFNNGIFDLKSGTFAKFNKSEIPHEKSIDFEFDYQSITELNPLIQAKLDYFIRYICSKDLLELTEIANFVFDNADGRLIWYGNGNNGKSLLANLFITTFDEYFSNNFRYSVAFDKLKNRLRERGQGAYDKLLLITNLSSEIDKHPEFTVINFTSNLIERFNLDFTDKHLRIYMFHLIYQHYINHWSHMYTKIVEEMKFQS